MQKHFQVTGVKLNYPKQQQQNWKHTENGERKGMEKSAAIFPFPLFSPYQRAKFTKVHSFWQAFSVKCRRRRRGTLLQLSLKWHPSSLSHTHTHLSVVIGNLISNSKPSSSAAIDECRWKGHSLSSRSVSIERKKWGEKEAKATRQSEWSCTARR